MKNNIFNIALLMCEGKVESLTNITSIFNTIKVIDNSLSFTLIVLLNTLNYTSDNFSLFLFLQKLEEDGNDKAVALGKIDYEKDNESDSEQEAMPKTRFNGASQKISKIYFEDVYMPGPGNYEMLIYKYEKHDFSEEVNINDMNEDNLVASYSFLVEV